MKPHTLWENIRFEGLEPREYAQVLPFLLADYSLEATSEGTRQTRSFSSAAPAREAKAVRRTYSFGRPQKKPAEVEALEKLLSFEYKNPVSITSIKEMPMTRKQVKEVYFLLNHEISKVWVFKADPKATAKELTVYHIIHAQGIPTGKPLGFSPSPTLQDYPFEIAILGGVVEHAGEPYDHLLDHLKMRKDLVFTTALAMAHLIAAYHLKLTRAEQEFEKYNITIHRSSPRRELETRLLAALRIPTEQAEQLIRACETLHDSQSTMPVISHGDLHTGNIVTIARMNPVTHHVGTSIQDFGVIDWESITYDSPFGDLADFWVHHQRQAKAICKDYEYPFGEVVAAYKKESMKVAKVSGVDPPELKDDEVASLVQSTLWHLYEMYDPVRKDPEDIRAKAGWHSQELENSLGRLEQHGLKKPVAIIRKELQALLQSTRAK